jgi:ATP-dependent Clp protease ATP-binding subunit ClpX
MSSQVPSPLEIAEALGRRVIGQSSAVREMAVALSKKLSGVGAGNILLIGSSGCGKTTLMRAVEHFLSEHPPLADRSATVRVHANILSQEAESGRRGEALLGRLLDKARMDLGSDADLDLVIDRARRGLVFVDEIDKIRSRVGEQVNVDGIRAQEALLTLIENEAVPHALPEWAGGGLVEIDTRGLLFVAAGAFEGLYDAVYDRVTIGRDRGSLQAVTVLEGGKVHEERPFALRDHLRQEDLFDYGMTPQFLSRFEGTVLLNDLGTDELVSIFLETPDSGLQQARDYFASRDIQLAVSPAAVRRIAVEAARQPRLGARALKEVFRRVIRDYEFDPSVIEGREGKALMIDQPEVEAALGRPSTP